MVRLTADLVSRSPHFINPIRQRELELRGNKIPAIENLGTTQDQFDVIDLSDNEIQKLENLPLLNRLTSLFLSNNRISRIAPGLGPATPHLETLILNNNRLAELSDLDQLADIPTLRCLSLIENPVTKRPNYRLYVIHLIPKLRLLDFRKIKQNERTQAQKQFATEEKAIDLAPAKRAPSEASKPKPTHVPAMTANEEAARRAREIQDAIGKATTIEEVERLQRQLQAGFLPEASKMMPSTSTNNMPPSRVPMQLS